MQADADTNSEVCDSLVTQDSAPYYAEAGIIVMGEDPSTFNLAKQRKIKEALAILLDVDASDVSILEISEVKNDTLTQVQWSMRSGYATAISTSMDPADYSRNSTEGMSLTVQQVSRRSLLAGQQSAESPAAAEGSIAHMLKQQAVEGFQAGNGVSSSRRKALNALAVPIGDFIAAGVYGSNHRELLAEQLHLSHASSLSSAAAAGGSRGAGEVEDGDEVDSPGQVSASTGDVSAIEMSVATADPAVAAGDPPAPAMSAVRKLQQIITLDQDGQWQSASLQDSTTEPETDTKPPAGNDSGEFTASEGPGDVPVAAEHNQTVSTPDNSSSDSNSSSSMPDISAVLAAQPVVNSDLSSGQVEMQVLNSNLESLLQPARPTSGPAVKKAPADIKPKTVQLTVSFRDAFMPPVVGAVSSSYVGNGNKLPLIGGSSTHGDVDSLLYDGPVLPAATQHAGKQQGDYDVGSKQDGYTVFDAIRPSRSLIEDDISAGSEVSSSSSSRGHERHRQHHHRQQESSQELAAITAQRDNKVTVDPQAAAEFVRDGRVHHGTPRPRPKPVISDGGQRQQGAMATPDFGSGDAEGRVMREVLPEDDTAPAGAAEQRQQEQQTFRLMGPKKAIKPKQHKPMFDLATVHRVPNHLRQGQDVDDTAGSTHQRRLLAANSSTGVLLVTRVSGFKSQKLAAAAADSLEAAIVNGTLASTLASQGWTDVTLGVAFTRTGMRQGYFGHVGVGLIVGVAAAGGVLLCLAAVVGWYIKKKRLQGAAIPHTTGHFITAQQHSPAYGNISNVSSMPAPPVPGVPVAGYPTTAPTQQSTSASYSAASAPMVAYSGQGYGSPRSQNTSPLPQVADMGAYSPVPVSPYSYTAGMMNSSPDANPFLGMGQPHAVQQQQQQYFGAPGGPQYQPSLVSNWRPGDLYTAEAQQQYNPNGWLSPPPVFGNQQQNSARSPNPYRPVSPAVL